MLPAPVTTGPDGNGVLTTTEFYLDDDGKKIKVRAVVVAPLWRSRAILSQSGSPAAIT